MPGMQQLLSIIVVMALSMNVAQAADDKNKKDKGKGGIQALLTKLGLNADQKKKLGEFNKAHSEKYDQARKLKGDARKAKLREITVARNALLEELLTGEQQAKLKELKAAKKGKKKESKDK
jgi:Spy/CpxP family protein refolding chaperone|tara:strand:+ start:168 stop:530 length:363 start_codon:yes stop_codon:yes gene_type:complete